MIFLGAKMPGSLIFTGKDDTMHLFGMSVSEVPVYLNAVPVPAGAALFLFDRLKR